MDHEHRTPTDTAEADRDPPTGMDLSAEANEEQLLYAKILAIGMYIGLVILLVTFAVYLLGILPPAVPIEELGNYWTLSAHEYLVAIERDFLHRGELVEGWRWLWVLNRGDFLNFVGIAILALVTIVCYLGILPTLVRKKDWTYSVIAIVEVAILSLAAFGLGGGGH